MSSTLCKDRKQTVNMDDTIEPIPVTFKNYQIPYSHFKNHTTNNIYTYKSRIAVTGNSEISLYEDNNKNHIIVKYTTDQNEKTMIKKLQSTNTICNIVEAKCIGSIKIEDIYTLDNSKLKFKLNLDNQDINGNIDIIIMPLYDGDLNDLSPELLEFQLDDKIELMIKITDQVHCLFTAGFCYTDLKFGNILFKCQSKNKFSVHLGDIGGIGICGSNSLSTFPPFQQKDKRGYVTANNNTIVWGLLMVFLNMFTEINMFSFSNINKYESKIILKIIKSLSTQKNIKVIQFIYNITSQLMEDDLSISEFHYGLHKLVK